MHTKSGPVSAALAAVLVAVVACQGRLPTALDEGQLPDEPLTVQVQLPWSDFGSDLQVIDGYGTARGLANPLAAHTYGGSLEARTLVRFGSYPSSKAVVDSTGVTVNDTILTFIDGEVVLTFDTLTTVAPGPVSLDVGALQEEWDSRSATWAYAIDTIDDQRAWTDPGAGPVVPLASAVWDPTTSATVAFLLDSTAVNLWTDGTDQSRGARIDITTDGALLTITNAYLRLRIRPHLDPDSIIRDSVMSVERTFVYDPPPSVPTDMRVGGAPSWRTTVSIAFPPLTGPPELCAAVGCPFSVESGHISYAGLALTTEASEPAFQPLQDLRVDVRPVLSPASLPKSPLGLSQTGGIGTAIAADAFGASAGDTVEIPITSFVRTLLGGPDSGGHPPPSTLALLSQVEPASFSYASFMGPGSASEPFLNLVLTVGIPQELP